MRHSSRPVHTYSIVARNPESGELGVAVQSYWLSVGSVVTWAEAGVGVVATQSFSDPAYGPRALDLIRNGLSARKALASLLAVDPDREERQVAVIDCRGQVAAYTGKQCIDTAAHHRGKGFSVQVNVMNSATVLAAMVDAYEASTGDLAHRMLVSLQAGERAGGDIHGRQSAALLVVRGRSLGAISKDRLVDLRVEDHPDPNGELQRLLILHRAFEHMARGDEALGSGDMAQALIEYRAAAEIAPDNLEMVYWHAVALATNDRLDEAMPLFRQVFAKAQHWVALTRRLHKPGIIPDTEEGRTLVERIVAAAETPASTAINS